jgi:hypothetical protein
MKIVIDEKALRKYNIPFTQFLLMMFIKETQGTIFNYNNTLESLKHRGYMYSDDILMEEAANIVQKVLCDSEVMTDDKNVEKLCEKLQSMWPSGKKDNKWYWRGNKKEITLALKKFFKFYGKYTNEQILNAAQKYIESFSLKGDTYMELLKYFIIRERPEMKSNLATYIERYSEDTEEDNSNESLFYACIVQKDL